MTYLAESFNSLATTWPDDMKILSPNMFQFRDKDNENCKGVEPPYSTGSGISSEFAKRKLDSISGERGELQFSTLRSSESVSTPQKFRAVLLHTIPE